MVANASHRLIFVEGRRVRDGGHVSTIVVLCIRKGNIGGNLEEGHAFARIAARVRAGRALASVAFESIKAFAASVSDVANTLAGALGLLSVVVSICGAVEVSIRGR